ncbi:hypothetical protein BGZ46_003349 [Entomortierella lignicola]|nr:hypothetical protein BGZ46_003349 [Entomortierella lignicola]
MCNAKGPSESLVNCVMNTIKNLKFSSAFHQHKEIDFIDEEEIKDNESHDAEYDQPSCLKYQTSKSNDGKNLRQLVQRLDRMTKAMIKRKDKERRESFDNSFQDVEAFLDTYNLEEEETEHRDDPVLLDRLGTRLDPLEE